MILRSPLFVPGNKANMLEKALDLEPDAFVPDMEDSVPAAEKANARETIAALLPRLAASGSPVIPRVNSLDTEWIEADLAAVVGPHVFGISVGKVRRAGDIAAISRLIGKLESARGLGRRHAAPRAVDRDGRGDRQRRRDLPRERAHRRRRVRRRGLHERL